jgi:GT2 family glycosyltransferase
MPILQSNYHFVIPTQFNEKDFWEKSQIAIFLDKSGYKNNCSVVYENKKGIPFVYNSFINDSNHNKILIFVHDDVLIEDLFWEEKLNNAFEKYDVVGLAGAKKCDLSRPSAWHLMSDRQDHCGEVAHSHEKNVWTTCFGPTNSRVLVMDGLFIAINTKKIIKAGLRFDERFDFHHSDITFCLKANKLKLKMGVVPIRVVHFGLGDSMNSKEWENSASKFKEYYENQR